MSLLEELEFDSSESVYFVDFVPGSASDTENCD